MTRRICSATALAALLALSAAVSPAHAQAGQGEANGLVGSWRVTITVTSPAGYPSFPVLMTFHADGTLLQSRLYYIPAFGVLETTAHGGWKRDGSRILATTYAIAQGAPGNAALNGAFFGTEKVSFQPVLASDGNSFTAMWTSTVYDPGGSILLVGSGTMAGVVAVVEP
jgi:hypothetical protein